MRVSTYVWPLVGGLSISLVLLQIALAGTTNLRAIMEEDAASWKAINGAALTPDGRWLAYVAGPAYTVTQGGHVDVVLRSVLDESERRYPAGLSTLGAGNLKMSPSGRWIAFQVASAQRADLPDPTLGLVIVEIATGKRRDFGAVRNFSFVGDSEERLLLETYPDVPQGKTFSLLLQTPDGAQTKHIPGVSAYKINPTGTQVAWLHSKGLEHLNIQSGRTHTLDASLPGSRYEKMTWSSKGNALAIFREDDHRTLLTFTQLDPGRPRAVIISASTLHGFPPGYEITITAPPSYFVQDPEPPQLQWGEDEKGVFLGIQPVRPTAEAIVGTPNLVLWHWRDHRTPNEKKILGPQSRAEWGYVALQQRLFWQLTGGEFTHFVPNSRGGYALAYNVEIYGWKNRSLGNGTSSAYQLRDYVLIDLRTGQRRSLPRGIRTHQSLSIEPQLSPSGRVFLYQDHDANYIAYDTQRGTSRNLTSALPTHFYDPENDIKSGLTPKQSDCQLPYLQGWTGNESHVLLFDYHDVWAVPLKSGHATNLTGNGKQRNICYNRIDLTAFGSFWKGIAATSRVDLNEQMYFGFYDRNTGEEGLAHWLPEQHELKELHRGFADLNFYKASKADINILSRTNTVEPLNYYRVDNDWRSEQRLTDINPQQKQFYWPAAKYLSYKTARGDTRQAVLRLPQGYIEGHAYPTVVAIYKKITATLHAYRPPDLLGDSEAALQANGYAVLLPDIAPRINEPGPAALEAVMAAVDSAVKTGIVDAERLGLTGHSYGGFETAYIVSQTNRFKAATPYAGVMNLWSDYGGTNGTQFKFEQYETNQTYMAGPWWENWEAYLENSPVYHARDIHTPLLLVHGNDDRAVPFTQSLELFSTLKRLGDRSVVLLEYVGEGHGLEMGDGRAMRDFQARTLEFFNHFLKGNPAPSWWSDGLSRYEGQVPAPGELGSH